MGDSRTSRAYREWARRWNLRSPSGEDLRHGAIPLVAELQPVIIADDVSALSMPVMRRIHCFGGTAIIGVVGQLSTIFVSTNYAYRVRSFRFTWTGGTLRYGIFNNAFGALASATDLYDGRMELPLGTDASLQASEMDYGTTATDGFGGGAALGCVSMPLAASGQMITGDWLILPGLGNTFGWQLNTANITLTVNHVEVELLPYLELSAESQPIPRP